MFFMKYCSLPYDLYIRTKQIEIDKNEDGQAEAWAKMTFKPKLTERLRGKRNKVLWRELPLGKTTVSSAGAAGSISAATKRAAAAAASTSASSSRSSSRSAAAATAAVASPKAASSDGSKSTTVSPLAKVSASLPKIDVASKVADLKEKVSSKVNSLLKKK